MAEQINGAFLPLAQFPSLQHVTCCLCTLKDKDFFLSSAQIEIRIMVKEIIHQSLGAVLAASIVGPTLTTIQRKGLRFNVLVTSNLYILDWIISYLQIQFATPKITK